MSTDSTRPEKPSEDYPLFPHRNGQWAKKVRGRLRYFGPWSDPDAALARWLAEKDYLLTGRKPPADTSKLRVGELANMFLTARQAQVDAGEMTARVWHDYYITCRRIVECFGRDRRVDDLDASDFARLRAAFASTHGPAKLGRDVQETRTLFNWALQAGKVATLPRFGPDFKRPSKRTMRVARQQSGARMFEAGEVRKLLDAADQPLHAMILLGINAAYGNGDVARVPESALDLDSRIADFPRPKTAIQRRAVLWPETVASIQEWLARRKRVRPEAKGLVFVTDWGTSYAHDDTQSLLVKKFRSLMTATGMYVNGRGFYGLRRSFRTVADEVRDPVAVDLVMGHLDDSMGAVYRQRIDDARLEAVVGHVRVWLYGDGENE